MARTETKSIIFASRQPPMHK